MLHTVIILVTGESLKMVAAGSVILVIPRLGSVIILATLFGIMDIQVVVEHHFIPLHRVLLRVRRIRAVEMAPRLTAVITGGTGSASLRSGELSRVLRRGPPCPA